MRSSRWAASAMALAVIGALMGRCWAADPKAPDKPKTPPSPSPTWTIVVDEDRFYEDEYARIRDDISKTRSGLPDEVPPVPVADRRSLIWATDGDPLDVVLRRTQDLAGQLGVQERAANGTTLAARLRAISAAAKKSSGQAERESARHALYLETCRLRRTIALMNPLLDFDEIVFMPSAAGIGGPLQVSGYAKSGPGLPSYGPVVVSQWKEGPPVKRDLLKDVTYDGKPMQGGYHNYYDLSPDLRQLLFVRGVGKCWQVFAADLQKKTAWRIAPSEDESYDPCWLPNGRVVFVRVTGRSTARCHINGVPQDAGSFWVADADGGNSHPFSFHEITEMHPSVDWDGMLIYTRWDYIDRDFNAAHHLWRVYSDGRDARAPHGNYPRNSTPGQKKGESTHGLRPWGEYFIRAIPNAPGKYAAVAAQHHRILGGVPCIIDINAPDDDANAQVCAIDGATVFPREDTKGWPENRLQALHRQVSSREIYSITPLSESVFIVSDGMQAILMDVFGNQDLLFSLAVPRELKLKRDTDARCLMHPRPFRGTRNPPIMPEATYQGNRQNLPGHRRATIGVANVYDAEALYGWPAWVSEKRAIKALRIVQLIPKPRIMGIGKADVPRIGYGTGINPRIVLGTVPVEKDGSVYCEAPVGKEIYFQALDSRGVALQSMRSGTYVQPGEQLMCQGCHEDKHKAPAIREMPLAFCRQASKITPDVNHVEPITFARLVQPVFRSTCTDCHSRKGVKPLRDVVMSVPVKLDDVHHDSAHPPWPWQYPEPLQGWVRAFDGQGWFNGQGKGQGYRTYPLQFGSWISYLGQRLLDANHQEALRKGEIPDEHFRRVIMWLDVNSPQYGAFTHIQEQWNGDLVWPEVDVDPKNPTGVESARELP